MDAKLLFINDYFPANPGYSVQTQTHNCHEIVFYDAGCHGKTTIDGIEYEFKSGDIVVNRRGVPHSEIHFSNGNLRFIGFECEDFCLDSGVYHNLWDVKLILDIILKETVNQSFKYNELISCKLHELFICIERANATSSNENKTLIFIKNYLDENYMQNINIHELAKVSGYSNAHFRYLFTKDFGISPREYLIERRCQKAIELLKFTKMTCADIASQCGFYDSSQFAKMLKSKYSATPLAIRNQANN